MEKSLFNALTRQQLKTRYGAFFEKRVSDIDAKDVPEVLRPLIPYAELWGVSDDGNRDMLVEAAPLSAQNDLKALIDRWNPQFDEWLAGPEASGSSWSTAYIAFSNMRMAYDYLSVL
jgi:hypothetical protein